MIPNEAFPKYFPDAVLSGMEDRTERSSCLRGGTCAVMHKIVSDYSLDKMLGITARPCLLLYLLYCRRKQCSTALSGLRIQSSTA